MSDSDDLEAQLKTTKKKKTKVKKKTVDSDDEDGSPRREEKVAEKPKAQHQDPGQDDAPREGTAADTRVPAILILSEPDDPPLEQFYEQLKQTKKPKKRVRDEDEGQSTQKVKVEVDIEALQKTDRDLTYSEMLALAFDAIKGRNIKTRDEPVRFRPPQVVRDGTKKVVWTNFPEICQRLNRSEDHLFAFALSELGTTGRLDGNHCFVLKGRFTDKHLEGLLRKYVTAYVQCQMCRSLGTQLVKDPHSRLTTLICDQCGANRTVQSITSGFSAQIGRRKRK